MVNLVVSKLITFVRKELKMKFIIMCLFVAFGTVVFAEPFDVISHMMSFESYREEAYRCPAGVRTIGYGCTIHAHKKKVTADEAKACLCNRAADLRIKTRKILGESDKYLSDNQRLVIISFVDNVGIDNFKSSTFLKLIKANKVEEAGKELNRWVYAKGVRLNGLVRRRSVETKWWYK